MKDVLIIDNQPISRIGLKALINFTYKDWTLFDSHVLEAFRSENALVQPTLVLLSLDFELNNPDVGQIKRIRMHYPTASIIILGATIAYDKILPLFVKGVKGFVSKQETEIEILECLRHVAANRNYISCNNLNLLLNNLSHARLTNSISEVLSALRQDTSELPNHTLTKQYLIKKRNGKSHVKSLNTSEILVDHEANNIMALRDIISGVKSFNT